MKNILIIAISVLTLASCKSKKVIDPETLPKDISQKPDNNISQQSGREKLSALIKEIEKLANSETCNDVADWNFAAIGSKPCGGPSSYIAYPKKIEDEIVPKIKNFTQMQSAFNTKYGLVSDCMMVMPPSGIRCVDGKAVLVTGNSSASEAR